ncbi:MAG: DEAD/DEAH box helicase [Pseudobdellovibrionaceae bacterium]
MAKDKNTFSLSPEQQTALEVLQSGENVFLTGGAGSGKSHLIRAFLSEMNLKTFPILASTGAAAVIVGGRTFHSFFGLGIMEGGPRATFEKARNDQKLLKRLNQVEGFIIDEISMIPSTALEVAESLCREARESSLPWGGLRVITVGDFAQLPPVTRTQQREWAFTSLAWEKSGFQICQLTHNQRVRDDHFFLDVLADVRQGLVTDRVIEFLESKVRQDDEDDKSPRLFPRRDQSEIFNQRELDLLPDAEVRIPSIYLGAERFVEALKKSAPVPGEVVLKPGAYVLFLQNDPQKRWINGTRGIVSDIQPDKIIVRKTSGREVTVEKSQFSIQDSEGNVVASVIQFPLTLAYATTIHKSQGATLDRLWVDLSRLWEPGHAYVALSRLSDGAGLKLLGWSKRSFITDPQVLRFYQQIEKENLVQTSPSC